MIEIRHPQIEDTIREKDAYNKIYQEKGIHQAASFYLWLIELLGAEPGQSLLDISCGEGDLVRFALRKQLQAVGVDLSEVALQLGQQHTSISKFGVGDAQLLPIQSHSFDFVTNIGSIEHYLDPAQGVQEIKRILKPAGTACILLPNGFCLLGNVKHVWQTGDVFDDGQPIQRYNTLNGWQDFLIRNGLTPFKIAKYEMVRPRTFSDFKWYINHPAKMVHLMLTPFIPLSLSNCFVYLCRSAKN